MCDTGVLGRWGGASSCMAVGPSFLRLFARGGLQRGLQHGLQRGLQCVAACGSVMHYACLAFGLSFLGVVTRSVLQRVLQRLAVCVFGSFPAIASPVGERGVVQCVAACVAVCCSVRV